jgi:uncharacterized RDD family membrane protein YckC
MPSNLNSSPSSWKQEVNRRVAAHKNRKGPVRVEPEQLDLVPRPASSRAAEVLARVNARYAKAPSYNLALADEGRAVVRAAEAATRRVPEVHAAQNMLQRMEAAAAVQQPCQAEPTVLARVAADEPCMAAPCMAPLIVPQAAQPVSYEVRWDEELPEPAQQPAPWVPGDAETAEIVPPEWQGTATQPALLEPPAIEVVDGAHPIPGNLIEFPRELVATRKARRRQEEDEPQLSIFEVDPGTADAPQDLLAPLPVEPVFADQFFTAPVYAEAAYPQAAQDEPAHAEPAYAATAYAEPAYAYAESAYAEPVYAATAYAEPVWDDPADPEPASAATFRAQPFCDEPNADLLTPRWSTREVAPALDQQPLPYTLRRAPSPNPEVAPTSLRLLAGVINASLMMTGLVLAGITAARDGGALFSQHSVVFYALAALGIIAILYTAIFHLLSDSTPGMRYAHLRLTNFQGGRTSRSKRLIRLGCMLLSALPLGLGFFWIFFDKQRLSWHDRLSGTCLRRY